MKYLILNGNPYRDKKEMDQYIDRRSLPALAEKFAAAQNFIIGFPLYVDAMPRECKRIL